MNLKTILFVVCCCCLTPSFAQVDSLVQDSVKLAGHWKGVITQYDGGYRGEYNFELFLELDGNKAKGRSYVSVDDIYVDMEVEGELHSGVLLRLRDVKVLNSHIKEGMEWCNKSYQMLIKREGDYIYIDGYWQGDTSFSSCVPGKLELKLLKPRA